MPLDVQKIQAICFDVDGTIRDTDDQYMHALAHWLYPFRHLLPRKNPQPIARRIVMGLESPLNAVHGILDRLDLDDEAHAMRHWLFHRRKKQRQSAPLIPGVREMLAELSQRYPMAIVSSRDHQGTMAFLENKDLAQYFQCFATALTTRYIKPSPQPVLWAAREMNVPPEACVMVGDTTVDIRAGRAAGAQTIGVLCGFGEDAELREHHADLILQSTADLINIL